MSEIQNFLVSSDWLEEHLGRPDIAIVDASWYLPAQGRNARAEYEAGHIPGAVFFDQDQISDQTSKLPHTLPSAEQFSKDVGALGLSTDQTIIVYDGPGIFSAPRVWWLLRIMGARDVRLLSGGLDGWNAAGRPVTSDRTEITPATFEARLDESRVASFNEMQAIVASGNAQVADARSAARFSGQEPEPRAGVRSGHMPGAHNMPSGTFSKDGALLPPAQLHELFEKAGIDLAGPIVSSCGSGITAAIITLALETLGHEDNRLYDGSWTEWGSQEDTPVVAGDA